MAPIELEYEPSYLPAALVGFHIFTIGFASTFAIQSIYRSYVALPASSGTRHREPLRKGYVTTFSFLALLSLFVVGFFGARFGSLSYRVWAAERGVELPETFFGDKGALRGGEHPGRLHVVRWLNDTPIFRDAYEIVAEKARHFWWGQQISLGLVSWSMYLAIEGQRRNISHLWAFLVLAQQSSLSYAQNLFFIAILLTPVPLPENVRDLTRTSVLATSSRYASFKSKLIPTKPDGFLPHPALYISLLVLTYTTIFLIPFAANTPSFPTVTILSRTLPFSYLILPYLTPSSWGKVHAHPHGAQTTYTTLFRVISVFSGLLHLKSTVLALFYNVPDSTYYRHSLLHPFKEEHRSAFNRSSTAVSRIFGAISEHPAVSATGWDVVLSGLSLGIWAAVRGLDIKEMLESSVPFLKRSKKVVSDVVEASEKAVVKTETALASSTRRRTNRTKKTEETDEDSSIAVLPTPRRRGRPRKTITTEADIGDEAYHPPSHEQVEEGDENEDEDWEAAAVAWGLIITGGLAAGGAGIYGAEVVAR